MVSAGSIADMCKSPRKARNVTRRIFRRLYPAGHETRYSYDLVPGPPTLLLFAEYKYISCFFP